MGFLSRCFVTEKSGPSDKEVDDYALEWGFPIIGGNQIISWPDTESIQKNDIRVSTNAAGKLPDPEKENNQTKKPTSGRSVEHENKKAELK